MKNKTPVLSDEKMRALGFTDKIPPEWFYIRVVGDMTTFNLTIQKQTGNYIVQIIDESVGDYAMYMDEDNDQIIENINSQIDWLRENGLDVLVDHRKYYVDYKGSRVYLEEEGK